MAFKQFAFESSASSDLSEKPMEESRDGVSYSLEKFSHAVNNELLDVIEAEVSRFKVHGLISDQLGLLDRQAKRNEKIIEKEIEDRWILTKEKAEVEGYTEGLNSGKLEAYNAEKPRIDERLSLLDALLTDLASQRELIFRHNEKFLMDLLAQLLRVIVLKEIELDQDYLRRLTLHLLEQVNSTDEIRIVVSEADFENVRDLHSAIKKEMPEYKNLNFDSDPRVVRSSCRVETNSVVVDGSVEEQIRNAMTVLKREEKAGSE